VQQQTKGVVDSFIWVL